VLKPSSNLGYQAPFEPGSMDSLSIIVAGRPRTTTGVTVNFFAVPMA
jgi:hypothetical protein